MRLLCLLCTLVAVALFGSESTFGPSSPFHTYQFTSDKEWLIGGVVHPMSGQAVVVERDLVVNGCEPIELLRSYRSPASIYYHWEKGRFTAIDPSDVLEVANCWVYFPYLVVKRMPGDPNTCLIPTKEGATHLMSYENGSKFLSPSFGLTNVSGETPSGKYDVRNTKIKISPNLKEIEVFDPDGTCRVYISERSLLQATLQKEILPNGNVVRYHYDHGMLKKITTHDPKERFTYAALEWKSREIKSLLGTLHFKKSKFSEPIVLATEKNRGGV